MAKPKPPVPVLVVDTTYGITGLRKSGGLRKLPGGMTVVAAAAGHSSLPEGLVPSEIHVAEPPPGVWAAELFERMLDALLERMDGEHRCLPERTWKPSPQSNLQQECACGKTRWRPPSPSRWSEWA